MEQPPSLHQLPLLLPVVSIKLRPPGCYGLLLLLLL
jgi:hypothetical protein